MAKRSVKCPKCGRSFALPLHLGRHMSAMHGAGQAKRKRKATRPLQRRAKRRGRRKGAASRFGLNRRTLKRLVELLSFTAR